MSRVQEDAKRIKNNQMALKWLKKQLDDRIFGNITLRIQNGWIHVIDNHQTLKPEDLASELTDSA